MARILLAEDDDSMRRFLAVALRRAGHDVDAVADGLEALSALDAGAYELMLADIVMPGMDGIELARRSSSVAPALKVMFITGFAAIAMTQGMAGRTDTQILSKPFHLRDLVSHVDRMLAVG